MKLIAFFVFTGTVSSAFGQIPVANFTASATSGCAPLTVSFTDQSTGSPTSWNWQFGPGQLSTSQNPTVTFPTPGVYTVKLVVRNANGIDDEEKIDYITVFPAPSASFRADLTTACVPATIQFTDNSSVPAGSTITQWQWTFGDGGTSTAQNPTHTYNATGFYTVTLNIKSSTGCSSSAVYSNYIRIVSGIAVNFDFLQPSTCNAPFVVTLQDQSAGPGNLSYNWSFGNGQPNSTSQNPTTTYPAAGNYTVQLNVQSDLGCTGSLQKTITIAGTTTNFTSPSSVCIGQIVNFQNNSSSNPVSSTWDFGDGTTSGQINPTKTYLAAGTYQVKLFNQYASCSDSTTKSITVIDKPVVDFTVDDSSSCKVPFNVQFSDLTPGATGWFWDFGDGTTSTAQNPTHQYNTLGDYTVTLTATSGAGCSNTTIKKNYIKIRKTTVDISNVPAGGCVPFTFKPLPIIITVDSIASYLWDLGEPGATYTSQFPTHVYNSVGTFPVKLTITTQSGCVATLTTIDSVRTGVPPTVNFSYSPATPICASTPITFTDLSTTTPGAQVQWTWNFGDNTNDFSQNPTHVFKDTGLITVTLAVSNNGCIDSAKKTLQILPPVANFGYKLDCNNRKTAIFSDSSLTNVVYGPISYLWDFGDGSPTSTTTNPTHSYASFGNYNVSLTVTNGPCNYTFTKPIKVSDDKADFSINKNPVCKKDIFFLKAINSDSTLITNYNWTVGPDPSLIDTTRTLPYSLPNNGSYDVTLTLTDTFGCVLTKTATGFISIIGPVAGFVPTTPGGCVNKTTAFNDVTTPPGSIVKWDWDFGDGTQQSFTTPPFTHNYSQAGSYTITMKVTDNVGCTDTYSNAPVNLLVTNSHAGFKGDTVYCPSALLQFKDTSSGPGLSYEWTFGDGSAVATLQNPQHAYPMGDADYSVKLKIIDAAGCMDSVSKTNYIKIRSPKPAFDLKDTVSICPPLVARFTFQGKDYKSFLWNFGDGTTSTLQDPVHFYNQYGNYTPKLYLIGNGGCMDSTQATVNVYDPSSYVQMNVTPAVSCNSTTATFNLVTPPFKFQFFYGDGASDTSQQKTLTHFYASPGNYRPYMYLYDATGCVVGVVSPNPVYVYGAIPLFGKDKKEFCDQGDVTFTNYTLNNDPVISNIWDFDDGTTSTATNPVHNFSTPGTYYVKLNVTTQNQCASSFTDTIRVYRTPVTSITSRDTLCLNMSEQFKGVLGQPDTSISWQWTFGNGSTGVQQISNVTYTSTGNYTVQLKAINKIGCSTSSSKTVYVAPPPTAKALTDPIIVSSGSGANLNMNYTGNIISYLWSPQINLDCFNCPVPFANPRTTTKYTVSVQDKYSCINKGDITIQVACDEKNFFIPNTFSPNGDGSNDVFYPRGKGLFRIKSLRIFNRWGELVYENREFPANDPTNGWNGMFKGQKATPDVYVYEIEIYCNNDQLIKLAGNVALIL